MSCTSSGRDPLLGAWHLTGSPAAVCEFFSNGRFHDECGVVGHGDPGDFSGLDDGRYYFGILNAFNENIGECLATPEFNADCRSVTLEVECNRDGQRFTLELSRTEP